LKAKYYAQKTRKESIIFWQVHVLALSADGNRKLCSPETFRNKRRLSTAFLKKLVQYWIPFSLYARCHERRGLLTRRDSKTTAADGYHSAHPEWTLTPIAADFNYILTPAALGSETQSQCQLHLPWIKNGSRRAIAWVRRAFKEVLCC